MTNGSLMKVYVLQVIIGLENQFFGLFESGRFTQVLL